MRRFIAGLKRGVGAHPGATGFWSAASLANDAVLAWAAGVRAQVSSYKNLAHFSVACCCYALAITDFFVLFVTCVDCVFFNHGDAVNWHFKNRHYWIF